MSDDHPNITEVPTLDVKAEGSVTDGIYQLDFGVENMVLLTVRANDAGIELLDQLLGVTQQAWRDVHERILAAAAAQGVSVAETETSPDIVVEPDPKHRADVEVDFDPEMDLEPEVPEPEPETVQTIEGDGIGE